MSENEFSIDEGESYFDIRFYAYTPDGEFKIIIVKILAWNDY